MVRQLQTYSFVFLGGHLLNSRILLFFFSFPYDLEFHADENSTLKRTRVK